MTYTYDEIVLIARDAFPAAILGDDNEGQVIVYTGLYPTGNDDDDYAEWQDDGGEA